MSLWSRFIAWRNRCRHLTVRIVRVFPRELMGDDMYGWGYANPVEVECNDCGKRMRGVDYQYEAEMREYRAAQEFRYTGGYEPRPKRRPA